MDLRSAEIERELARTREEMGDRIVELRRRGERTVRRSRRVLIIGAAVGATVVVGVVGAIVVYRMTRPPTARERINRVIPGGLSQRLRDLREMLGGRMPSVRLYVNDRAIHEEPKSSTAEKVAVRAAQAAGTAAAGALASRLFGKVSGRAA